ncbi:hypothetical protein SVAN01_03564 [Stagonosporopsis vannaccii]|nr:hypothetical protein SVAN01_03564 [Stagonosporopsis vannaccii]
MFKAERLKVCVQPKSRRHPISGRRSAPPPDVFVGDSARQISQHLDGDSRTPCCTALLLRALLLATITRSAPRWVDRRGVRDNAARGRQARQGKCAFTPLVIFCACFDLAHPRHWMPPSGIQPVEPVPARRLCCTAFALGFHIEASAGPRVGCCHDRAPPESFAVPCCPLRDPRVGAKDAALPTTSDGNAFGGDVLLHVPGPPPNRALGRTRPRRAALVLPTPSFDVVKEALGWARFALQGTRDQKPCSSPLHDTRSRKRGSRWHQLRSMPPCVCHERVQHVGTGWTDPDKSQMRRNVAKW